MVPIFWHKPPEGKFKLNIDDSFESQTINGGTGGVIMNQLSTWIVGFACKIKARNAVHAENLTLLHGRNIAKNDNIKNLLVETDS